MQRCAWEYFQQVVPKSKSFFHIASHHLILSFDFNLPLPGLFFNLILNVHHPLSVGSQSVGVVDWAGACVSAVKDEALED